MDRQEKIAALGALLSVALYQGQQLPKEEQTTLTLQPHGEVRYCEFAGCTNVAPDYALYHTIKAIVDGHYPIAYSCCKNGWNREDLVHLQRLASLLLPQDRPQLFELGAELLSAPQTVSHENA